MTAATSSRRRAGPVGGWARIANRQPTEYIRGIGTTSPWSAMGQSQRSRRGRSRPCPAGSRRWAARGSPPHYQVSGIGPERLACETRPSVKCSQDIIDNSSTCLTLCLYHHRHWSRSRQRELRPLPLHIRRVIHCIYFIKKKKVE